MTATLKPHGTYGRYRQGCRCQSCKTANNVYKQRLYSRRRRGEVISVPRPRVRRHVQGLLDQGATVNGLANATGVRADSIWRILDTAITRPVPARAAKRLLAATLDDLPDGALVDAKFAHELIGALLEAGITRNRIATDGMGWGSWPGLAYPRSRVSLGVVRKLRAYLDQVTRPRCEACGAQPWAGGRWCRPCYFDQTAALASDRSDVA